MTFFKTILFTILVTCSSALIAQQTLPSVQVRSLDGKTVDIQDFGKNDKITVLSFWATWCSPCKKELDAIADVYPDWQEEYNMELVAVTIDNSRNLTKVGPLVASKNWEYTILADTKEELKNALNVAAVPHTFLIDQKGNIVFSHSGYVPGDEYELEDMIRELAAEKE